MIDLYQSRRTTYLRCEWFSADEKKIQDNPSSFSLERKPRSVFYARYANSLATRGNDVSGVFLFQSNVVTIETHDDVQGVKSGDGIRMDGADWQVLDVQFREDTRRQQHRRAGGTQPSGTTYIQLRK